MHRHPPDVPPLITEEVFVGSLSGYVIGRKGSTIRRIGMESGASARISESGDIVIVSSVAADKVAAAVAQIRSILIDAERNPRAAPVFNEQIQVQVERFQAGKVIGRRGENIREIQDRTGARVRVVSRGSGMGIVRIEADTADSGRMALEMVQADIAAASREVPVAGGDSVDYAGSSTGSSSGTDLRAWAPSHTGTAPVGGHSGWRAPAGAWGGAMMVPAATTATCYAVQFDLPSSHPHYPASAAAAHFFQPPPSPGSFQQAFSVPPYGYSSFYATAPPGYTTGALVHPSNSSGGSSAAYHYGHGGAFFPSSCSDSSSEQHHHAWPGSPGGGNYFHQPPLHPPLPPPSQPHFRSPATGYKHSSPRYYPGPQHLGPSHEATATNAQAHNLGQWQRDSAAIAAYAAAGAAAGGAHTKSDPPAGVPVLEWPATTMVSEPGAELASAGTDPKSSRADLSNPKAWSDDSFVITNSVGGSSSVRPEGEGQSLLPARSGSGVAIAEPECLPSLPTSGS